MSIEVDNGVVFVRAVKGAVSVLRVRHAIAWGVLLHVISHLKSQRMRLTLPRD
jgi:hypothetical protein